VVVAVATFDPNPFCRRCFPNHALCGQVRQLVLVVDSVAATRKMVVWILESQGYDVVEVRPIYI
jgi:hypothetical protein